MPPKGPCLGAGPEPLLVRIRRLDTGGRDALAKKVGTSHECVRKLAAGVYDLTVGTLQRLGTALGVQ
jgi:hypothetical protein